MFADRVPDLVSVTGPVAACSGPRGTFAYGHGGYALLGQLIADVTASPYEDAATRMVLEPLRMSNSWFPRSSLATTAATGHRLAGSSGRSSPTGRRKRVSLPAARRLQPCR
jgi:CubicO group peptidase (beta-lactamase class C family)